RGARAGGPPGPRAAQAAAGRRRAPGRRAARRPGAGQGRALRLHPAGPHRHRNPRGAAQHPGDRGGEPAHGGGVLGHRGSLRRDGVAADARRGGALPRHPALRPRDVRGGRGGGRGGGDRHRLHRHPGPRRTPPRVPRGRGDGLQRQDLHPPGPDRGDQCGVHPVEGRRGGGDGAHRRFRGARPPRGGCLRVEGADDGHGPSPAAPQEPGPRAPSGGALSRAPAAALIGLLLVSALVVFALPVGRRPLVNQDEARFALLAREGVEHGQWLLPRGRGVIYLTKPPLFFWTVGLLTLPFGVVDERTAPIASVVSALATLLAVIALGRRQWSLSVGLAGAMVLATAPYFYFMSHQVLSDMMMTAWLAWALYFLVTARATQTPSGHPVGFYLCVAGALATKGPAALMGLAGALAVVLVEDGWRGLRWLRLPT